MPIRSASGAFISFTETATVSGSLGGTAFSGSLLTISVTVDSSTINGSIGVAASAPAPGTFTLAGFGSGTFTEQILAVSISDFNGQAYAGLSTESGHQIFATGSAAFRGYRLTVLFAPVFGTPSLPLAGDTFGSSLGVLAITGSAGQSSFATNPTPEPASLAMLGVGLAAVLSYGVARNLRSVVRPRPRVVG